MWLETLGENLKSVAKEEITAKQSLEKAFQYKEGFEIKPISIHTINENKEGQYVNGVRYERKVLEMNGKLYEGVFPVFESKFDGQLPEDMYTASDVEQMKYCTKKLAEQIEKNPELAKQFTPRQLEQIKNGEPRISGLTWHHNEEPGKMQLVDARDHNMARHTGGRCIWGGGSASR